MARRLTVSEVIESVFDASSDDESEIEEDPSFPLPVAHSDDETCSSPAPPDSVSSPHKRLFTSASAFRVQNLHGPRATHFSPTADKVSTFSSMLSNATAAADRSPTLSAPHPNSQVLGRPSGGAGIIINKIKSKNYQ